MSPRLRLALLAAVSLFPVTTHAGESISRPGVLHLSLDDAIRMALAKNFSIEVSRYSPKIARERVTSALGRFDPNFNARWNSAEDTRRDFFFGSQRHRADTLIAQSMGASVGLDGVTPWGLTYDATLSTDVFSGTNNSFNEDIASRFAISVNQPLLRGAGTTANLFQVRIARNNVLVSEWSLQQRAIDILTETVRVFNELHQAQENLRVAEKSQALARQTLNDNIKRAEIGVMSPLNITTARAEVASREEAVIFAQRQVQNNENFLKQLVTNDLEPMLAIQVEIDIPPSPAFRADVKAGIIEAMKYRPDYRAAIIELEQRHITLAFEKNAALPRLDLTGSLRLLGFDNDVGTSIDRVGRPDQTVWTAGAIFSVPIPNREGRGAANAARLSSAQALVDLQRLEQQIIVEVDNASGQIIAARQRIASTAEASKLAQESLDAGEERLRAGTGTTFEVLELQKRLVEAEYAQLRARADYNEAVNTYYQRTGVTLREYRVTIGK
ncbi:MAG: TolC family protein [Chthoniobacteraceae bacterium]